MLIDVLSQRTELSRWKLPKDGDSGEDLKDALRKTVGTVGGIRDTFKNFCEMFSTPPKVPSELKLSEEGLRAFSIATSTDLRIQSFGDTVLVYSPLLNSNNTFNMKSLYGIMCSAAQLMVVSLAGKVAVRGAVEIGLACDAFKDQIYGPVLAETHQLESEVAQYPRIIVGPRLCKFLSSLSDSTPTSFVEMSERILAPMALSLVAEDDDSNSVIDFLHPLFKECFPDPAEYNRVAVSAWEFVRESHQRFEADGNEKLATRYLRLKNFMEPRISEYL